MMKSKDGCNVQNERAILEQKKADENLWKLAEDQKVLYAFAALECLTKR